MTLWQHVSEPYAPKRPAKNYRECYHRRTERIHRFAPGSLKASIIVERHVPKVGNSPIADRSRARYERLAGAQAVDEIGEAGLAPISREQPTTSAKRMAASRHSRWSLRRGAVVTLTNRDPDRRSIFDAGTGNPGGADSGAQTIPPWTALVACCLTEVVTPKQNGNRDDANSGQNNGNGVGAKSLEPLGIKVDCAEHGGKVHDPTAVHARRPNANSKNQYRPGDNEDVVRQM